MQFTERHERGLDNTLKTLRRCQVPDITGEEMLAFSAGYVVIQEIHALVKKILEEQKKQQQAQQQLSQSKEIKEPTKSVENSKPTRKRK